MASISQQTVEDFFQQLLAEMSPADEQYMMQLLAENAPAAGPIREVVQNILDGRARTSTQTSASTKLTTDCSSSSKKGEKKARTSGEVRSISSGEHPKVDKLPE